MYNFCMKMFCMVTVKLGLSVENVFGICTVGNLCAEVGH
jgi:hypothetical protein